MIRDPVSQMGQSNKKPNKKVGRRSQARKEAKKKAKKTIVTSSMQVPQKTLVIPPPPSSLCVEIRFEISFFQASLCLGVNKVLQKLTKSRTFISGNVGVKPHFNTQCSPPSSSDGSVVEIAIGR